MIASSPRRVAAHQSATTCSRAASTVGGLDDVAVFGEPFDRVVNLTVPELCEGLAFDRVLLATVLDEFHRAEPLGEPGEDSSGFDLGELTRIPHQDDLRVRVVGVVEEPSELAGADHRGLIRDDHGPSREAGGVGPVEVDQEPVESDRRDLAVVLELSSGAGRERAADHGVPGVVPGLVCCGEGVGLARACGADHDRDRRAVSGERLDHRSLLSGKLRVAEQRSLPGLGPHRACRHRESWAWSSIRSSTARRSGVE